MKTQFKLGPLQTKWLESLENNPERQTQKILGEGSRENYKACCLGEAAMICGVAEFRNGDIYNKDNRGLFIDFKLMGLRSHEGGNCKFGFPSDSSLTYLNDNGKTWPEIAAIVRADPEAYFTESK